MVLGSSCCSTSDIAGHSDERLRWRRFRQHFAGQWANSNPNSGSKSNPDSNTWPNTDSNTHSESRTNSFAHTDTHSGWRRKWVE